MFAAIAILGALCGTRVTGKGGYIDISMTDGLVSWMGRRLAPDRKLGFPVQPAYSVYETKDGKFIVLGIGGEQHFWRNFCKAIGRDELSDLTDSERTERQDELFGILEKVFLERTRDEWIVILTAADVPHGPAYETALEVLADPQLRSRGMITEHDSDKGKSIIIGSPLRLSEVRLETVRRAPLLGEHNDDILQSLGYGAGEIGQLREQHVI
jgi:crotonobetainyl-CoA:carnitine CoA-transferase CaiB-like acyl-CoA transferase